MRIIRHCEKTPRELRGAVYALGNFDGVHIGHQKVIACAVEKARADSLLAGVLVFEPHPLQYFFPDESFFRLTPFRAKTRILASLEVDVLAALPFDAGMANRTAEAFIRDVLHQGLGASHLVVGYDFRFGKNRTGDTALLAAQCKKLGIGLTVVEAVTLDDETCSSTRIRQLLSQGHVADAAVLLGRPWHVESHVITGDRRGRTIGFPTANLSFEGHVEPALGVYAVRVEIEDGTHKGHYGGVANVGRRPTFDKKDVLLEVHIFDFDGDIYGTHVSCAFIDFLRPERKFDNLDSLKTQILIDAGESRKRLEGANWFEHRPGLL